MSDHEHTPEAGQRVRHKKRGTEYEVLGVGKMQADGWFDFSPQPGGDGCFCTHHPDDPAHGTACYDPDASAVTVWDRRGGMSFPHGAPCTVSLKKEARQQWETRNPVDWHVLGFGAEERHRYDRFVLTERPNVLPILIDARLTRQDCYEIIIGEGIEPPRVYAMGYPNANCIGCVKATSPTYWNHVRRQHPEVFEARAEQSRRLGARLVRVNNNRIYLDELPPDAVGKPLKSLAMPECGLFCEERDAPIREAAE